MVERPDTVPPILLSFPSPPHTFPASSFLEKRFPFLAYYSSTSSSSPRPRSPPITPFSASQPHARLISAFVIPPTFAKVCLSQARHCCRLVSQAYALTQSQRQSGQIWQYAQHSLHNPSTCFILILCSHLLQSTLAEG